mmetsp:Transcript_83167/g.201599  ORF Transcript_83167/g.201599 Transcript_83167/m.201599 type:complete len:492 (-) Transcript_83167:129-1604(-)
MGSASDVLHLLRVYWSLFLGNIVEWYEYAVYGYLEAYFEDNFFQGSSIATWLGFMVTFLARPLGGIVLGITSDMVGRRTAINISIVGMLVGTCGQGLLPSYASGNDTLGLLGVVLLVLLRLLQGLSAAGEIGTISTYITEVGSHKSLGRSISLIAITGNIGFLSAKATVFALESWLGEETMRSWGWRLPFLLALLPGLVAVVGRRGVPESGAFLERRAAKGAGSGKESGGKDAESTGAAPQTAPVKPGGARSRPGIRDIIRSHGCNMAIGICAAASFAIISYGGLVWMQSYLRKQGLPPGGCMLADLCARGTMLALALLVGWLTDVKGVGWVTFCGACLIAVGGLPLFALLAAHPTNLWVVLPVVGLCFGLLAVTAGTVFFLFVAELFPADVRGAAVGLTYNTGISMFGGLAPVIAQASLSAHPLGPGLLLSAGGAVSAAALAAALCLESRGLVKLAHVRPEPYFFNGGVQKKDTTSNPAIPENPESENYA